MPFFLLVPAEVMMWKFSLAVAADASAKTDGMELVKPELSKSSFRIRT
jgi:hypothetical protein